MTQRQKTSEEPKELYIETQAQEGEFIANEAEKPLICTDGSVLYTTDSTPPIEIPYEEITETRRFTDQSLTGFHLLGHLFLFIALVLTALSVQVTRAGLPLFDVVTAGAYLATVLAYPTAITFYKKEVGEAHVLEIETSEEKFNFITTENQKEFDRIHSEVEKRAS